MEVQVIPSETYRSIHGGLDTRLNALGIKTVSMDYTATNGDHFQLIKGDGFQNDYKILLPKEDMPEQPVSNYAAHIRNGWGRLADVYDQAVLQSQAMGHHDIVKGLEKSALDLRDLMTLVETPAFLEKPAAAQIAILSNKAKELYDDPINPLIPISPKTAASIGMPRRTEISAENAFDVLKDAPLNLARRQHEMNLSSVDWGKFARDNQTLHSQQAKISWERDAMPLAGKNRETAYQMFPMAPDIRSNWQVAQNATTPLGQIDAPTDDPLNRPAQRPGQPHL